jgi:TonB family protein
MPRRLFFAGLTMIALAPSAGGVQEGRGDFWKTYPELNKAKALAVYAPPPDYPFEARQRGATGKGIAVMEIERDTGKVIGGRMSPSTGNKILDDAALEAFRHWRFKPGTVSHVQIPIRFTMQNLRNAVPQVRRKNGPIEVTNVTGGPKATATYAPRPNYPFDARARRITGTGAVILDIDGKTGSVVSAHMDPSTGHAILDDAALAAFHRWRFRSGISGTFRIPITFTMRGARY